MVNLPDGVREWILVVVVLALAGLALQFKRRFIRSIDRKRMKGSHVPDAFTLEIGGKIFAVLLFFISFMLILQILGIDIIPLLTFSGIGAAVLGFASKDVVANFFGGLMIYITRPFTVNDVIELPEKKMMGTVEEVGWYLTTIRDLQKKSLYIPNSLFSTELLFNHSRMSHRRIEEQIRFRITDPDEANRLIEKARQMIETHPEIDPREQVDVFLLSISPYGIVIDVKAYTKTTKYLKFMEIKQELLLQINQLANGIKQEKF